MIKLLYGRKLLIVQQHELHGGETGQSGLNYNLTIISVKGKRSQMSKYKLHDDIRHDL